MVSVVRSFPIKKRRSDAISYHVLLTAILQSRFAQLCKLSILISWTVNLFLSWSDRWYWRLLPFKAIYLFGSVFLVFILRKANLHIHYKPYSCYASQLYNDAFSASFLLILATYITSAWLLMYYLLNSLFNIPMLNSARPYELPRFNEAYLYTMFFATWIGIIYSFIHVALDYDLLKFPSFAIPPRQRIIAKISSIIKFSVLYAATILITSPFAYLFFRSNLWSISLKISKIFYHLHRSTILPSFPLGIFLFFRLFIAGFFIIFYWEFSNKAFAVYMTLGPKHRGKLITSRSDDKNATLVSGIATRKRELTQMIAFQELVYIAYSDSQRRIEIYRDIDRVSTPSTWVQTMEICTNMIKNVQIKLTPQEKISINQDVNWSTESETSASRIKVNRSDFFIEKPESNIFEKTQDNSAFTSQIATKVFKLIENKARWFVNTYHGYFETFLESNFGKPFRQTQMYKARQVIPNLLLLNNATQSLTQLIVHSMTEDNLGTVQKNIPYVLEVGCMTLSALENYLTKPTIHWTDIDAKTGKLNKEMNHLEIYFLVLKESLHEITLCFHDYFSAMKLDYRIVQKCERLLYDNDQNSNDFKKKKNY